MYLISITLAKLLNLIINLFRLGAGYTWPGHLALQIYPDLLHAARLFPKKGMIFISATNGKTTTTKLISHILRKNNYSVLTNTSGANLLNGIASALLLNTSLNGKALVDYGVFEVDEFALPLLLKQQVPDALVLLNLSRDQLDRYGEVDIVLDRWSDSISQLPKTTTLVLDSTQENLQKLAGVFNGTTLYFDDTKLATEHKHLSGTFNTKNINAALKTVELFGVSNADALLAITDFEFAWGRGEQFNKNSVQWRIMLAKNPASFNNNLEDITHSSSDLDTFKTLLFILNDNIPDGRDVSWIYDIDPQKLISACQNKNLYFAGKRAYDMAVRLWYAGVPVSKENICVDIEQVTKRIAADFDTIRAKSTETLDAKHVLVLPNYSAMLNFRKIMLGRSIL